MTILSTSAQELANNISSQDWKGPYLHFTDKWKMHL
jgi:hypothetical protein